MKKRMHRVHLAHIATLHRSKNRKGFTLIELIVVMAIIAILVLLAAPRFLGYTKDAKVAAMQQDVKVIADAMMLYNLDHEEYPHGNKDNEGAIRTNTNKTYGVVKIDNTLLDERYIKSTRNELTEYVFITEGRLEGGIAHIKGVPNKDGKEVHGLDKELINKDGGTIIRVGVFGN